MCSSVRPWSATLMPLNQHQRTARAWEAPMSQRKQGQRLHAACRLAAHLDAQCHVLGQHQRARRQRVGADGREQKAGHGGVHHGAARRQVVRRGACARGGRRRCTALCEPCNCLCVACTAADWACSAAASVAGMLACAGNAHLWVWPQSGRPPAQLSRGSGPHSTAGGHQSRQCQSGQLYEEPACGSCCGRELHPATTEVVVMGRQAGGQTCMPPGPIAAQARSQCGNRPRDEPAGCRAGASCRDQSPPHSAPQTPERGGAEKGCRGFRAGQPRPQRV